MFLKGKNMLFEELKRRKIPKLLSREEMLEILQREEYGYIPDKPQNIRWEIDESYVISNFCAGKATVQKIYAVCTIDGKEFSFPFYCTIPTKCGKYPFFIHINFRDDVPDRYMPTEELIDNGFAVLSFCYKDVTADNDDFTDGLAGILYEEGKRKQSDAGKIAMWAWAAQRVMDYAETKSSVLDTDCAIVCGHSRLGKTALLTAATDERFKFAYSNDSGCSGAAITRGKQGENVKYICETLGYWFCENYKKYIENERNMPFDQHYLLAAISPRYVCVGSASEDLWADPFSEQLCCLAASDAFKNGFVSNGKHALVGDCFFEGDIGYHLRRGKHYFSREDWNKLICFINKHR